VVQCIINIINNMVRNPDIRSLQAFITVAGEGSVSAAAELLNLTQPAVSLQLKRLADDTGLTLFKRTGKGLELTRDGAHLLIRAERVLESLNEFAGTAQRMSGKVRGKLRIGTIVDPSFIRLGPVLASLLDTYPEIRTELTHGISGDVLHRLRREQIDVGFYLESTSAFDDPVMQTELQNVHLDKLTEFNYRVVAPPDWKAELENASWQSLAALPWIGTPGNSVHSRLLNRLLKEHGCERNVVAIVDQEPSMIAMAQSGVGLCLCRESIALSELQSAGLSMASDIVVPAALYAITLKSRRDHPLVQAFYDVVSTVW